MRHDYFKMFPDNLFNIFREGRGNTFLANSWVNTAEALEADPSRSYSYLDGL